MTWVLVASGEAREALRPLVRAHERTRAVSVVEPGPEETLRAALTGAQAVLVVGSRRRAPRSALPGLFLEDADGRRVPAGWLPDLGAGLAPFARAAARVAGRDGERGPVALLGQRESRYLRLAGRMEARLAQPGGKPVPTLRWTSERIVRDDVVRGLRLGLGAGIYFGHGRPEGWTGYHGLRSHHLVGAAGEPLGALLSVTCLTANRHRVGLSFSEAVVVGGAAAAAVGAVAEVAHLENMRWMIGLARALRAGERLLGPALLAAAPGDPRLATPYRIVGDPLAALVGTEAGAERAARVFAPPAELVA